MEQRRLCALAVGLAALLSGCAPAVARVDPDPVGQLLSGGLVRTYRVHVPAGASTGRRALVVALHGRGGTGSGMARLTHLDAVADRYGFVVVYPDGVDRSWSDGLQTPAATRGVDDVGFIRALIAALERRYAIDPHRVYATGMSNGAMLTELLGCRLAGTLAAIAPVAGSLPQPVAATCRPARPLPVLEIHGTDDPWVPYGGGALRSGVGTVLSAPATSAEWSMLDGCRTLSRSALPDTAHDGTSVTVARHRRCRAGAEVELDTVAGAGHTWPGGTQYLPALIVGHTSRQFDASVRIWRFFAVHTR